MPTPEINEGNTFKHLVNTCVGKDAKHWKTLYLPTFCTLRNTSKHFSIFNIYLTHICCKP